MFFLEDSFERKEIGVSLKVGKLLLGVFPKESRFPIPDFLEIVILNHIFFSK
jgi:hypothetical protein